MARKSKSDRINEILRANPALRRDDPRIDELISAESLLRKVQRAAAAADVTVASRNGSKRSPELVALDAAERSVRRLRNELQIDKLGQKRSEAAGVKVKRSPQADSILNLYGPDYSEHAELLPGTAALMAAHGLDADDLPEHHRERFRNDLAEQQYLVPGLRERLKQYSMF